MFYICSKIPIRSIAALAALGLLLLSLGSAPALTRDRSIADPHARARIDQMNRQNAVVHQLINMNGGSIAFDARSARALRRDLIDSAGEIPKLFRKPLHDRDSHALPVIWSRWEDFEARAADAEDAAKGLRTRSLDSLRRTLPAVIQACQSCHRTYRAEVNEFITH